MARRSSGGHGRGGSWLTACFFPSSSGKERGEALGAEDCMCVYAVTADYQRQENTEISLKAGERVEVIEKSESGWWFVRTAEEQGWVPATYLVSLTGRRDSHRAPNGETEWYITVQPFSSSSQDELGFESGVIVEVIQRNLEGWWFIRYGGKEGWAPAAYLKKIQDGVTASNQPAESNKASVQGQVEIIGNLMEISNLLNKKPANERHSHTQTDSHSANTYRNSQTDSYTQYSGDEDQTEVNTERDSEDQIKTHIETSVSDSSGSVSVSDACVSAVATELCVSSTVSSFKAKTVPASPAIARVAPQRFHSVENKPPSNNLKPPPRRENSLGFQLPQPPDPPTVEAEYYTIAEFRSCLTDGISFSGGQRADVIEKNSGGWWYVQIGEKEGWAPCSYIDKRKKPTLNRQTSTLTRPKVPPPAPPIKKQNSLPCVESEIMTTTYPRVYEEPEYDVPTIGFEFDPDLDFFPSDAPTKATPPLCQRTVSFTLGDEEDDEGVYANGGFRAVPHCKDNHSPSSAHRASMWDPPEYDAPTIEPSFETNTTLYAQSNQPKLKQQADESKSKPSVRPKPTNQDCSSLRKPQNQEQPSHMQFRTSRTSEESDTGLSDDFQSCLSDSSSFLYRTTAAYQQEEPCELSFPAGVQVEVVEKKESGWWFVRWGNEEGWAPTYYLQPIKSSSETSSLEAKTTEKINSELSWSASPELEISVQVDSGKMGKSVSLEKNEQRVNQSLKGGLRSNSRVGVKQLAVRPQNVLKDNTNAHAAPAGRRNDTLPSHSSLVSYNDQSSSSHAGNTESMRRKVPVSMVKPKPHLIHNNLREEYVSIADYRGDAETMSFPAGTRLEVLERNPNGWWYCRVLDTTKTRKGWVPSNFLERKS
ncbi:SH3 and PX domain-containing protein 2A isoform X1 [Danio rerio]|uniref:SH3 and PX domain-containing protein 2A isoform X1 n=1 Tax=Danio rerio TaxID=7955 RepID=A0ACD6B726_DANRE|nr:SH3 and PX domain-containing protein 2A [Danio rerio]|eukprot:XP_021328773.1 SH3 and PX domain-containing protein 2A [Danio rerio]